MMDPPLYTFGSFRLDSSRGLLHRGTEVIRLPETLARLLLLLIRANGEIVDKDTIAAQLWPGRHISDNYVTQQIYMLRQLLGEQAKDRGYVMMVRGRGYRFVGSVSVPPPSGFAMDGPPAAELDDWLVRAPPQVLDRYYRGCLLLDKQTASALKSAAEQFDAALQIDPEYVPALIGVARANALMAQHSYASGADAFPKAKAAILHALEIDPSSAEGRATLGTILLFCDWNWDEAEREIQTAIGLSPKPTSVYVSAAWFHICKGSAEDAVHAVERALSIEPSSPVLRLCLAQMLMYGGEVQRAIDWISNILESFPDLWIARGHRAQAFILNAQPAEALQDLLLLPFDRAEDLALRLPLLGRAYAGCGDVEHAESIYQALLKTAQTEFVTGFNLATVAVGLGRAEEALDHLERALEKREPAMLMLRNLPWFGAIAQRARFKTLLGAIWPA